MIKFAHFADLQLGLSRFDGAYSKRREEDFYNAWLTGVDAAIQAEVDLVIIAGDVFDSATPPVAAHTALMSGLLRLRECGIHTVLVDGNHERPKNILNHHPLRVAEIMGLSHIRVVTEQAEIFKVKGFSILAIPFLHGASLSKPRSEAEIIIVHAGCTALPEYMSSDGYVWDTEWDKDFLYVALGDWHGPKVTGPSSRYSGSIERTSFGDYSVPVGFWLCTLEKDGTLEAHHVSTEQRGMHAYELVPREQHTILEEARQVLRKFPSEDLIRLTIHNSAPLDMSELKKEYPFLKVRWRSRKTRRAAQAPVQGITTEKQWESFCSSNGVSDPAMRAGLELIGEV